MWHGLPDIGPIEKKFQGASSSETLHFVLLLWSGQLTQFAKYWACESK